MEEFLRDNFEVPAKNLSVEAQRRWRSAVSIVKNRRRRFRLVPDLDKGRRGREEMARFLGKNSMEEFLRDNFEVPAKNPSERSAVGILVKILPVVMAIITALYKKCFKSRLDPEGSPHSFNFDASPYDIENPPEINQKSTFLTTMNHEISNALASLDNLKQSINECQRFQEAWSSVLKEKYIPCSNYPKTLVALKEYRETAGNLFDKIDAKYLQEVISNKETVASSLDNEMSKIKEELNFYNKWRKYLKVTYIIIVTVILLTAIALQAVTLRRATIAVITVTGIKEIEACIGSFWDDQKLNLESKKKVIKKARRRYSAVMDEMVTIPLHVDVIKIHIGSVKEKVEFVVRGGEEAVEHGVVEIIELKMKDVMKEMNTLQENVELCKRQAQKANREFSIIISEEIM